MAKWKEVPIQEWEYDFSNPPKIDPIQVYTCDRTECGQTSHEPMPKQVSKHVRNDVKDFAFCSQECHDEFYLARMRRQGL